MLKRAVILAASLALATSTTSVLAADIYAPSAGGLKDPVIQEQVILPEANIYQEYAEWFIRGDVGASRFGDLSGTGNALGRPFDIDSLDFDDVFSASIGFGRYLTPNVRLGLDVEYRHQAAGKINAENLRAIPVLTSLATIPLDLTTTTLMLSAVYDFAPQRRFSPYVGGGVGWAFHQLSHGTAVYDYDPHVVSAPIRAGKSDSSDFAANFVTGVSVNVRKGLYLDMGYKFSYLGDARVGFDYPTPIQDPTIIVDDILSHEIKVGLRYDLY